MQRFNINWTAKALVNQMEKGKVNYDNAVQRNLVWDVEKKSLLIHSMIYGYAPGPSHNLSQWQLWPGSRSPPCSLPQHPLASSGAVPLHGEQGHQSEG